MAKDAPSIDLPFSSLMVPVTFCADNVKENRIREMQISVSLFMSAVSDTQATSEKFHCNIRNVKWS